MKKQKIQLLILGVLLVLVIAAFFGVRSYNNRLAEEKTSEENLYTVLSLTKEDVAEFSFSGGGDMVSLIKEDDVWNAVGDSSIELDQDKIRSLLDYVVDIQAELEIEGVTDFSQYGFDDPLATVTIKLQDDTVYEIVFGHFNEITSQYYLKLEGSDTVYGLSSNLGYHFQITLDDLKKVEEETEE
ncbi:MAG: DUF4340 domain-containing protein [Lachnospiraceae bacterium]|nr:DUF4340 domain-containing protein [Lachnospiraceae bacterium]